MLLTLLSVSVSRGRTLRVVDFNGRPVKDVFVIYHHEGSRPNPVHPITYVASRRSISRSHSAGSVEIPPSVHVHWPFPIESHPKLRVDLIYAPILHNGHAAIVESAVTKQGVFEVADDLATVKLADLSGSPALWEGTLRNLSSITGRLVDERFKDPLRHRTQPATTELTLVLAGHFVKEYEAFLNKYRAVARPRPEMPYGLQFATVNQRREWNDTVEKDLKREPRWGDVAQRLFAREAKRFADVDSGVTK